MESGIYCIENKINGKKYIGQAKDTNKRMWKHHRGCVALNGAIEKYGNDNFYRYIVLCCSVEKLTFWEQHYIKEWDTKVPNGYNLTDGGEGLINPLPETIERMIKNHADFRGKNHPLYGVHPSEETIEKQRQSHLGKSPSLETRKLLSDATKGIPKSLGTRKNMSDNHADVSKENHPMWGKHHSDETNRKIGNAQVGEKNHSYGKKNGKTSLYFAVSKITQREKYISWRVSICEERIPINIGSFRTEIEAAHAYDEYIIENKISRPLNFPDGIHPYWEAT